MAKKVKVEFKNGDRLRYVREAPEDAGMTITINKFIGTYNNGLIAYNGKFIPLIGAYDISNCFEKVVEPTLNES